MDKHHNKTFPTYEKDVYHYLEKFAVSFRIDNVKHHNIRVGSSASYILVINDQKVNLTAETGPSFKNTLSAGERNALALAFFLVSLDKDHNLAQKIVVFDDPITSLDEHRTVTTHQEIAKLYPKISQMIVLSHFRSFLCALWKKADKQTLSAIQLIRLGDNSSKLAEWDIKNASLSEQEQRYHRIKKYVDKPCPEDAQQVAMILRPFLEGYWRVVLPQHFESGDMLGPFCAKCRKQIGGPNEILSQDNTTELRDLLDFTNQFHHANYAGKTAPINDGELTQFAKRVLKFTTHKEGPSDQELVGLCV